MDKEFVRELNFDSDTFEQMKQDMNFVLQRLMGRMLESDTTEGTMNIKIDVKLLEEYVPNYNPDVQGKTRKVSKPQFKHKVTSAIKINEEKSGNMNNEMELVYDEDTGTYVMVPIADTVQRSIFDSDFQKSQDEENDENVIDETAIEASERPALPGPSNDVIDGEFKEVEGNEEKEEEQEDGPKKCITGWSRYGVCSCCGNNGVQCCNQCEEPCNSRCGWIDEPYVPEEEPGEELPDITDELMGDEHGEIPFSEGDDEYGYDEPTDEE